MPHIHDKYDFVVVPFIVYEGQVLLVNHPRYGRWIPPGGHIELDEDPGLALYREIHEETGLDVEILSTKPRIESPETKFILTPNYVDVHEANLPHRHIAFIYFAKTETPDFVKSSEHTELKWFSQEELKNPDYNLSKATIFYAEKAIEAAGI